jgi:hypothetical protein
MPTMSQGTSGRPPHPGTIVFVEGEQETERPASEVPESIRFARTKTGWVPVVKVVAYTEGDRRIIREFAPDGTVVRSTVQVRKPS